MAAAVSLLTYSLFPGCQTSPTSLCSSGRLGTPPPEGVVGFQAGLVALQIALQGQVHDRVLQRPAIRLRDQSCHLPVALPDGVIAGIPAGIDIPGIPGLRHRPVQLLTLDNTDPDSDDTVHLKAGACHLSVAHDSMEISDGKERTGHPHRKPHGGAPADQTAVHVPTALIGVHRGDLAIRHRGADDTDHGIDRDRKAVQHGRAVLNGQDSKRTRKVLSEGAAPHRHNAVICHLDVQDVHREGIPRLRALDIERSRRRIFRLPLDLLRKGFFRIPHRAVVAVPGLELQDFAALCGHHRRVAGGLCCHKGVVMDDL